MRVGAIVPAYNEADRIEATLRALQSLSDIDEIVVIDDGSDDETSIRAQSRGVRVITLKENKGKGHALETGIENLDADIYLFVDADLGASAQDSSLLLAPIQQGLADMVIATFPAPARKGGLGFVKRMACKSIARYGKPPQSSLDVAAFEPKAPLSGQRALTRACIERARPFAPGYGIEVCLSIDLLRAGMRVIEVATAMNHRETGRTLNGFIHRGRQYLDIRRALHHRYRSTN